MAPLDGSLISALGVAFLLGLRHALDADHVAAVSTFVSGHRGVYGACVLGTFWGVGHTAALLSVALAMTLLRVRIPSEFDIALEALASIMVILLAANVLRRAGGGLQIHRHEHEHGGRSHGHLHLHVGSTVSHAHRHAFDGGARPLLVGALHGLAGSAALMLVVVATMPSMLAALVYVIVFGLGSTVGMVIVSGVVGIPFLVGRASERVRLTLQIAVGIGSLGVGVAMLRSLGWS